MCNAMAPRHSATGFIDVVGLLKSRKICFSLWCEWMPYDVKMVSEEIGLFAFLKFSSLVCSVTSLWRGTLPVKLMLTGDSS